jgi:hypothetical protein
MLMALAALVGFCGVSQAQDKPPALYDPKTFSFGVGAGYEGVFRTDQTTASGATAIGYIARPLADFALVARGSWNFGDKEFRFSPGVHYRFPVAGEHFAAALSYDIHAHGNDVQGSQNEWSAGLVWSRHLGRSLVLGASASYGLDTHDFRPVVQLTIPLKEAKN